MAHWNGGKIEHSPGNNIPLAVLALALILLLFICVDLSPVNSALPWPLANQILSQVKPPVFPNQIFSVISFGAVGDGKTDDTAAFARAISACNAAGGGHVVVPAGTYLTGAILLKSNVDLHLEKGSILMFSELEREYPLEPTRYQGIDLMNFSPLVYIPNATNVAITGSGTLDGALTQIWNWDAYGAWELLEKMGHDGVPIAQRVFGPRFPLRTVFLEPYNSTNVLIQGITIRNSFFWQIHPLLCTNVIVDHVTTNSTAGNSDGCDPEGSKNVIIENCNFSTGDDDIAIKAGRNFDSQRTHRPSENIVVINCTFHGTWGMISCGSEQSDGVAHVFAYNLSTSQNGDHPGVRYLLYLKSNSRRGGYIEDINLDKITGVFTGGIVHATMTYNGETGPSPPRVENITLSNITDASAPYVLNMIGLPNDPIKAFTLTDSTFINIAQDENLVQNVDLIVHNVTINGRAMKSPD
ncbi:MAG TPA: glycoside hydrolase family 28 protein [Phycisphaerae bacterium]|nr:glycoside hydrolase family 28 protein [Phycisphaerae bacterium]